MLSFARLASFALFLLSLSFLTSATSTSGLVVRDYGYGDDSASHPPADNVSKVIADLKADVEVCVEAFVHVTTISQVCDQTEVLVGHVNHAAVLIQAIGDLGANVDVDVKAKIVAQVAAVIKIIVKAFATVSLKFGLTAVLALWAKIDACIHLLLVNLDVCIEGILALVVKLLVEVDVKLYIHSYLSACATLLRLVA